MITESLFSVLCWAAAGGTIIFIGLLLEKLWDDKTYKNISHLRRSKIVKCIGKWVAIIGVVVEIIVALLFAQDAWESDPRDQPVKTIKAEARLVLADNETIGNLFLYPAQNWWLQCNGDEGKTREALYLLTGTSAVISPIQGVSTPSGLCIIEFKSFTTDSWISQFQGPKNQPHGPVKEVIKTIHDLMLIPVNLQGQAHIIRGRVALTFNDSVTKYFDIGNWNLDSKAPLWATNNTSNEIP